MTHLAYLNRYRPYVRALVPLLALPLIAAAALPTSCGELVTLIEDIAKSLAAILFALAVVMILVSAFYFLTGGGSEDAQKKAKTFLIYAIIGVVVALFAFVLPGIVRDILGGGEETC